MAIRRVIFPHFARQLTQACLCLGKVVLAAGIIVIATTAPAFAAVPTATPSPTVTVLPPTMTTTVAALLETSTATSTRVVAGVAPQIRTSTPTTVSTAGVSTFPPTESTTPTSTAVSTETATSTVVPDLTPTPTVASSATPTATITGGAGPVTRTATVTPTATSTYSATMTDTPTDTATLVPTRTNTVLPSATVTPFSSATPTWPATLTLAPTSTPLRTATMPIVTFGQPHVLPPPLAHVEPLSPVASLQPVGATASAEGVLLNVPFRSQYDSTAYQYSNCGPTALAMVLEAFGLNVPNDRIRTIANQLQGTTDVKDGIALDYLVQIGQEGGLRAEGLADSNGRYHQWTMGDIIREIRAGNPVITLVHFAALPAHATSGSTADHYVVVVGLTGDGFIINDPASVGNEGYHQVLRPDELLAAWNAASIKNQAAAFLPPVGHERLQPIGGSVGQMVVAVVPTPATASVALVAVAVPATVPAPIGAAPPPIPATTSPRRSTLPPPPNATVVSYSLGLHDWQRPSLPATLAPSSPASTSQPDQPLVLAEHSSDSQSALPIAIVVVLIGAGALAIVKAPRGDDFDRLR